MGNTRNWTTKFNAQNDELRAFLKQQRCTSISKRRAAMERAATMPNRLPPVRESNHGN